MDPEIIDWESIESEFVEDDTYENINAPKWIDLSAPDELVDDEAWFCKSFCKHPKNAEDFLKLKSNSKIKLLRSVTISEFIPFRERNRRFRDMSSASSTKGFPILKPLATKKSNALSNFQEDNENKNPNFSSSIPNGRNIPKKAALNPSTEKNKHENKSSENSSADPRKPQLKSTFSARNLLKGREILNQITEFCTELKKFATKTTKNGKGENGSRKKLTEVKEAVKEKQRTPPLLVEERREV